MKLSQQLVRKPFFVAFGQALQSGGLTSVDLAATRNPTTVTLTASDGSAAPIAAADAANAGMMSAADKTKLDGLFAATTRHFASRAAAAAAALGTEVTHLRSAGYAVAGDRGGALYRRAAAEPAHALKLQSADGAWWELVPEGGAINVRQAGAAGDNVTDDHQAFADALTAFPVNASTLERGSVRVVVPEGKYFLGATLHIRASVILEGHGVAKGSGGASVLRWPGDTAGIVIQRSNTAGSTAESPDDPTTQGGDGSIIRNLTLNGSGSFGAAADGIWLRAAATIEECVVNGFARDGISITATAGAGGSSEGNANVWRVTNCRLINNKRHGMYVDGADVNAGTAVSVDANSNGRWGIYDSSFLGNTYVGCHIATNGLKTIAGNAGSSFVHYNGPENGNVDRRYAANVAATEAQLIATAPGSDPNVWIEVSSAGASANIPTWLAAQPAGSYFHGGAFRTDNANARNLFLGCYTEADHAPAQIVKPTQVLGGLQAAGVRGSGGLHIEGNAVKLGNLQFDPRGDDAIGAMELDLRRSANSLIYANVAGDHPSGTQFLGWDNVDKAWAFGKHANLDSRIAMKIITDLTNKTFGRATKPDSGYAYFPLGFFLGNGISGRQRDVGSAPPTTGTWARGDIRYNNVPLTQGAPLGWVCTAAGTPGTWVEMRCIGNQTAGANQTALANATGGVRDGTLSAVGDTSASNQAGVINDNFTDLHALLGEIRTALVNFGLIKGSA